MTTADPAAGPGPVGSGATAGEPRGSGDSRSLGDIVSDITTDLGDLVRQELDLAKVELKQEAAQAGKGAGMLGGAAVAGHLVLVFLSLTAVFALDEAMPLWAAALIVTAVWAVVAAVLAVLGRSNLKKSNPQLPTTQQTLKEDAQWAKAQKS